VDTAEARQSRGFVAALDAAVGVYRAMGTAQAPVDLAVEQISVALIQAVQAGVRDADKLRLVAIEAAADLLHPPRH
jgi:hypothetical protein